MPALIDKGTLYNIATIIAGSSKTSVIPGSAWAAEPRANVLFYPERDLMYTDHRNAQTAPPNTIPATSENIPSLLDLEYAKDNARNHGSLVRGLLWRAAGTLRYGDSSVEPYEKFVDTIMDLEDALNMDLRVIHPLDLTQVYAKAELGRVEHQLRTEFESLGESHLPPIGQGHRPSVDDLLKQIGDLHKNSKPDEDFGFNMDLFFEEAGRCAYILGGSPELLDDVAAVSGIDRNVLKSFADIGTSVSSSADLVSHLADMSEGLISAAINYARKKPPKQDPQSGGGNDQNQQQQDQQDDQQQSLFGGSGNQSGSSQNSQQGQSNSPGSSQGNQSGSSPQPQHGQSKDSGGSGQSGGIPQLTDQEKQQLGERNARNDEQTKDGVTVNVITGSVQGDDAASSTAGQNDPNWQEAAVITRAAGQTSPYDRANDLPFEAYMDAIKPIREVVDDAFRRLKGIDGSYQLNRHQRSGKFDPNKLGALSCSFIDNPFMRLREEYPRHLHVGIIVDDSGSMGAQSEHESPLDAWLNCTRNMDLAIAFLMGISEGVLEANGRVIINSMNRPNEFHEYTHRTREEIFRQYDAIGGTNLAGPLEVMREQMRNYEGVKIIIALSDGELPQQSLTSYHQDCARDGISARLLVIGDEHGLRTGEALLGPENAKELSFATIKPILDEWCTELARQSVC